MNIAVSSSMVGGVACPECGNVDTGSILSSSVDWQTLKVTDHIHCSICGEVWLVFYPVTHMLVFSVPKQAYESRLIQGEL